MKKVFNISLFIFRRDLRLDDNTALIAALKNSNQVIPCFILDPRQVSSSNKYRSAHALQFMIESLQSLNQQLAHKGAKLYVFYGKSHDVIEELLKEISIDAVFLNKDYTPFSTDRDELITHTCQKNQIEIHSYGDLLLNEPQEILTKSNTPFSVFTAFYKSSLTHTIKAPEINEHKNYFSAAIALEKTHDEIFEKTLPHPVKLFYTHGGTEGAMKILHKLSNFDNYDQTRDFPAIETTNLSAHNKFGTISIRKLYKALTDTLGINHPLIRQLYWRDFFTHVAWHNPHVFGHAFHEKYEHIPWSTNIDHFGRWCTGTTGFPIVDAGMRQLNETGFMHNRVRMLVGSFLVKDLHINWQWGERYFAQKLVDYDPCVNNGNWQWVASTGCDAMPYFRIFNPWLQQAKFDPECVYIKTWIPELKHTSINGIHQWHTSRVSYTYPAPMVDHAKQAMLTKEIYKKSALKH